MDQSGVCLGHTKVMLTAVSIQLMLKAFCSHFFLRESQEVVQSFKDHGCNSHLVIKLSLYLFRCIYLKDFRVLSCISISSLMFISWYGSYLGIIIAIDFGLCSGEVALLSLSSESCSY